MIFIHTSRLLCYKICITALITMSLFVPVFGQTEWYNDWVGAQSDNIPDIFDQDFVVAKKRESVDDWIVFHSSLGNATTTWRPSRKATKRRKTSSKIAKYSADRSSSVSPESYSHSHS